MTSETTACTVSSPLNFETRPSLSPNSNLRHAGRAIGRHLDVFDAVKQIWVTLRKFDRLELHEDLLDMHGTPGQFRTFPVKLCFWRYNPELCIAHISHLFYIPGFQF